MSRSHGFKARCVLSCVFLAAFPSKGSSGPIQDSDLPRFNMVLDILKSRPGMYPHGKLHARVERGTLNPRVVAESLDCDFEWDGTNHRCEGTRFVFDGKGAVTESGVHFVAYKRGNDYRIHQKGFNMVSLRDPRKGLATMTDLYPDTAWFTVLGRPWSFFLEDEVYKQGVANYEVVSPSNDALQVSVTRKDSAVLRFDLSLACDGNLVGYELLDDNASVSGHGSLEWERDGKNRFSLKSKSTTLKTWNPTTRQTRQGFETLEITKFDPNYAPVGSRFQLELSKLPPGTLINDEINKKQYRSGGRVPEESIDDKFAPLIQLMKRQGFSKAS